jgi:hypothetical protein
MFEDEDDWVTLEELHTGYSVFLGTESHVWIRVKLLFNSILIQRFVAVSPFAVLPSRYLIPATCPP